MDVENVDQITEGISDSVSSSIIDTLDISSKIGEHLVSFGGKILIALAILIIGMLIIKMILHLSKKAMNKRQVEPIVHNYIIICIKAILLVILIISILSTLGVPTTSLIAVISAAGVAIALALQNSLSNLAGGLLIILNKPFSKGDLIEAQGISGIVEEIHLMNCKLHTFSNKDIIIPNGNLFNGTIVNCSSADCRRVDTKIGVSYDADIEKVKSILWNIVKNEPKILTTPKPIIGISEFGDSAIIIDFNVWCKTEDYWDVAYTTKEQLLNDFRSNNIEIPYPQLDVKIKENA